MPIVLGGSGTPAVTTPQSTTTQQVFDYIYDTAGKAVIGARVQSTLNLAGATDLSPTVNIGPLTQTTTTDTNGFWQFNLVPNSLLTPAGTVYTITTPYNTYDISVPTSGGPFQSSSIVANAPIVLAPATTNLTGPITISGNETVTGNLTVQGVTQLGSTNTGALSTVGASFMSGDLSILSPGRLLMTAPVSKLVPGATQFSIRNTLDTVDNLLVSNTGNVTVAGTLSVSGATTLSTLTATAVTASTVTASTDIGLGPQLAQIIVNKPTTGGNAGIGYQDGGTQKWYAGKDASNNFNIFDTPNGRFALLISPTDTVTLNNALSIPSSAAGTVAPSAYGSTLVKIATFIADGTSGSFSFTNIPQGFRHLLWISHLKTANPATGLGASGNMFATFNGDTSARYAAVTVDGQPDASATPSAVGNHNATRVAWFLPTIFNGWGEWAGGMALAINYTDATSSGSAAWHAGLTYASYPGIGATINAVRLRGWIWSPSPAATISSVTATTDDGFNLLSSSRVDMYGIP